MGRKIMVLDAFTNGHEAARAFIQRQGWTEAECEIVFCGTHLNLLKRLSEGPAYAVVPVRNSIAGEVDEVTSKLSALRDAGYDLLVQDEFDLQINHCLLAPQHVQNPEDLDEVMSHEKAIQQCGKYLDKIGVTPENRSRRNSTGNAAKAVARLGSGVKIGAIAPKAAADEYGLKILAENIQDVPDNKTTFLLLENKADVKPVVVGIIGINGGFGRMLKRFFEQLGCTVIGSDKDNPTSLSNSEVATQAEAIIFAIPIKDTPAVIRSLIPHIRERQLLMDVTSIKQPAVEAMLESNAQVLGLHPMFRPEGSFEGQTIVAFPVRLNIAHWKTWAVNVLAATRAKIKWSIPAVHDGIMLPVQVNTHLANLVNALLIVEDRISVSESLDYASPFYRVALSQMGRLVSQNPGLYTSIIMENPGTVAMLERRIKIEQRLLQMIRDEDQKSFKQLFVQACEHFGSDVTKGANELFMRLIGVLNTLYGKNSVTLEFTKASDHPGLLERILRVFGEKQINLTGINSVFLDGNRLQFTISFEQSRSSDGVRRALEKIESWPELKVKILE